MLPFLLILSNPLFIVFEDAPAIIRRRNANILQLLNIHEKVFHFPIFIILTEKSRARQQPVHNDMMMIGGLNMNVIMGGTFHPRTDNRSHIEQYFDNVMEKSFVLPYPGGKITVPSDIMVIDVPVPQDTKFKYSYEKRVEEDEKLAMRNKHIKELEFFLRAHHLYCPETRSVRYLDLKRIKYWLPIIRMAYSLQVSAGMTYLKEQDIYDVYNKSKDTITRTGKPVYVSENAGDTLYGVVSRKCIELALKVAYNTQKEAQPDTSQEVRFEFDGDACRSGARTRASAD